VLEEKDFLVRVVLKGIRLDATSVYIMPGYMGIWPPVLNMEAEAQDMHTYGGRR